MYFDGFNHVESIVLLFVTLLNAKFDSNDYE